jgi:GH25 family lysozyme M1 (1,4-beta-N-acetylmuramidase)
LVDELKAHGKSIGFYTSASQWRPITGNSQQFSAYPLWFAHYNGQRNFDDFVPFGGWQMPTMKQFSGDVQICGKSVDENWKPS